MKIKNIILSIFITVLIIGCGTQEEKTEQEERVSAVKTALVEKEKVSRVIRVGSEAEPYKEVFHTTDTGGEIEEINLINGVWVEEGRTIVELSNPQVQSSYLQAEANYINAKSAHDRAKTFAEDQVRNQLVQAELSLTSAKMNLQKAERGADEEQVSQTELSVETARKNYEVSKKNYERNKRLFENGLIAEQTFMNIEQAYETAENNFKSAQESLALIKRGAAEEDITTLKQQLKNAEAIYNLTKKMVEEESWKYDIQAAKSNMLTAQSGFELAKDGYEELEMKAKISGVVTDLNLEKKNKVNPGERLFNVINNDDMVVKAGLNENEIVGIQRYDETEVYFEAVGKTFKGTVLEINPTANPRTKKFDVKIRFKNMDRLIKKGMYANVQLVADKREGIVVPKQSILIEGVDTYIFIVKEDRARKIRIDLGETAGDKQEILGDKINAGDRVVVEGQYLLNDNDKVKEVE